MKQLLYILFLSISVNLMAQDNNTLTVEFEGIKTDQAKLFVALYDSEVNFLKKPIQGIIVTVKNGNATAVFNNLKPSSYAISSFLDKNNNGKLDTNFMKIPKEPTAMSNNAKGSFGPPKFKDAKFTVQNVQTSISINY